jgi:hypothetical protein
MSGQNNKTVCDYNEFRRPRYFHGMLLEDRDFQAEQGYHAAKRRLLNRSLHGTGIVCGLELSAKPDSKEIQISPGLALDCGGNEIWVDRDLRLDLGKLLKAESPRDLECPPDQPSETANRRYVVIQYREIGVDPVAVYVPGGGCDQRACEHSRTREGYCVRLVRSCTLEDPEAGGLLNRFCECLSSAGEADPEENGCLDCAALTEAQPRCQCRHLEEFCASSVPCPDCRRCGETHDIVLGRIDLDDKLERIQHVCMNDCRSYVLTGRLLQHVVVSALAGAGAHVGIKGSDVELPPAVRIAHNPIWALCWLLRYFVIEQNEFEVKDCELVSQGTRRRVTQETLETRLEQVTARERNATTKDLETLKGELEERLKQIEARLGRK